MGEGWIARARERIARRSEGERGEVAVMLPVDRIDPNPYQPRRIFRDDELEELAESVRQVGVLQPIVVRPVDGRYQIIAGERRWRAARLAGLPTIPAVVRPMEDHDAAVAALVENLQRSDLSFWEEAAGYERLLAEFGMTQEQLAAAIGKSQPTVANKLRLLRLPWDVQEAARRANLGERHVRALLRLDDPDLQREAVRLIAEGDLSAREAEALVESLARQRTEQGAERAAGPQERTLRVIKDVRILLNTFRQGIETLQRAGLAAEMETTYGDDCIEVRIRIPHRNR